MLFNYANVFIFAFIGICFVFVALWVGSFIRPQLPTSTKLSSYECGEKPIGSAWMNFNIRFYITALVFLVFDVEIVFMFPVVRVFKELIASGMGLVVLLEILAFVFILLIGFAYVWIKGDLSWLKKVK